jgi:hypothetical protein
MDARTLTRKQAKSVLEPARNIWEAIDAEGTRRREKFGGIDASLGGGNGQP